MSDFSPGNLASLRRALLGWYARHHRDLPWRGIGDAYRVWVSEVMLQQTTVAAVIPYYERFLQKFPDVRALASADETDVLRLWEGLGYYSRARNLHRGAQEIVRRLQGEFPRAVEELQSLPGIGRYTAGAIASFAFDDRAPIVEANTLRLYCRLLGFDGDPRSTAGQTRLWSFAETILPRSHPGQFNQALTDFGATVCIPSQPDCPACPLKRWCRALRDNQVAAIPQPARRPVITEMIAYAVAVRRKNAYLLRRCPPGERWAGLWDFPRFESEVLHPPMADVERHLTQSVAALTGLEIELGPHVARFRHSVTRYRITLNCYLAEHRRGRLPTAGEWAWVAPSDFPDYPLSVTGRKYARRLQDGV